MPTAEAIRKAIRAVKDPELNLNIIDIGLVYDVEVDDAGDVRVEMTLTSPGCPAGAEIIADVKRVVGDMEGVRSVEVELVWEPYWTPEKMDPRVRTFLGFYPCLRLPAAAMRPADCRQIHVTANAAAREYPPSAGGCPDSCRQLLPGCHWGRARRAEGRTA